MVAHKVQYFYTSYSAVFIGDIIININVIIFFKIYKNYSAWLNATTWAASTLYRNFENVPLT